MGKCPPGVFCIENMTMVIIIIFVLISIYLIYKNLNMKEVNNYFLANKNISNESSKVGLFPRPSFSFSNVENDVLLNPYQGPERNIQPNPNINYNRGVPINIQTQPPVDSTYRQVGILSRMSGDEMVIPLMGRPLITNRNKWNFYAMSDKNNMVKIGVYSNGKNCMSNFGCDDLSDGQIVTVDGFSGNFKVTIYENDSPKYIPYI
jgi:hypothetical protein